MAGPAEGRVPAIHVFEGGSKDVDARDKPVHDDNPLFNNGNLANRML
jgi:hypothetical protein